MYELLLSLHILAASVWVGGGVMSHVFAHLAARSQDPARQQAFAADSEWVGGRVFGTAAGLTLLFGIALVINGNWAFTDAWILIGIAIWLGSMVIGAVFITGEGKRLAAAVEVNGPGSPEAAQRLARITLLSRIDLAILVLAIFDMAIKPGA